jgi:hypothetical protein
MYVVKIKWIRTFMGCSADDEDDDNLLLGFPICCVTQISLI